MDLRLRPVSRNGSFRRSFDGGIARDVRTNHHHLSARNTFLVLAMIGCLSLEFGKAQHVNHESQNVIHPRHGDVQQQRRAASVNRHALVEIHVQVTARAKPHNDDEWILTVDELENPVIAETFDEKVLNLTWQSNTDYSSSLADVVGTTRSALALPLRHRAHQQQHEEESVNAVQTLILALWQRHLHRGQGRRVLVARQVLQVSRGTTRTSVQLHGKANLVHSTQETSWIVKLLQWFGFSFLFVGMSLSVWWYTRRVQVSRGEEGYNQQLVDQQEEEEEQSYDGEELSNTGSLDNSDDDEEEEEEEEDIYYYVQHEADAKADENEEEIVHGDRRQDKEDTDDDQQGWNSLQYQAALETQDKQPGDDSPQRWVLANLPPSRERRSGFRPMFNDNLSHASSNSSSELAMPPGVERYVVRPKPAHGITFEAEMERFNALQLGSPQASRTGHEVTFPRGASSPAMSALAYPNLDRAGFMSPPTTTFASVAATGQPALTSPSPFSFGAFATTPNNDRKESVNMTSSATCKNTDDPGSARSKTENVFLGQSAQKNQNAAPPPPSSQVRPRRPFRSSASLSLPAGLPLVKESSEKPKATSPATTTGKEPLDKPKATSPAATSKLVVQQTVIAMQESLPRQPKPTEASQETLDLTLPDARQSAAASRTEERGENLPVACPNDSKEVNAVTTEACTTAAETENVIATPAGDASPSQSAAPPTRAALAPGDALLDSESLVPAKSPAQSIMPPAPETSDIESEKPVHEFCDTQILSEAEEENSVSRVANLSQPSASESLSGESQSEEALFASNSTFSATDDAVLQASQPDRDSPVEEQCADEDKEHVSHQKESAVEVTTEAKQLGNKSSEDFSPLSPVDKNPEMAETAKSGSPVQLTNQSQQGLPGECPESFETAKNIAPEGDPLVKPEKEPKPQDECQGFSKGANTNAPEARQLAEPEKDAKPQDECQETSKETNSNAPTAKVPERRLTDATKESNAKSCGTFRPVSTEINLTNLPRVTPPYEKPLTEIALARDSARDTGEAVLDPTLYEAGGPSIDLGGGGKFLDQSPSGPAERVPPLSGMAESETTKPSPVAASSAVDRPSEAGILSQENEGDGSSPFTYVSTLSPDSRASSSYWSQMMQTQKSPQKMSETPIDQSQNEGVPVDGNAQAIPDQLHHSSETKQSCLPDNVMEESRRHDSSPLKNKTAAFPGQEGAPQDEEPIVLPDVTFSNSLRDAMQNLEAPVWQFSSEEAMKPVERKRRRKSSRKSTEKKAPFMSPKSTGTSRPGLKRKLIDLTDFKTPPLSELGTQSKRRAASSTAPKKDAEMGSGENSQGHEPDDTAVDWADNQTPIRNATFARRKRPSGTKPA